MQPDTLFFGTLLSFIPMALICAALRFHLKRKQPLSRIRLYLFRAGLIVGILGSVAFVFVFVSPFPLVGDANGEHTNPLDNLLYMTALGAAFTTIVFSFFGRRAARLLLIAAGVVLLVLVQWGFVANHW